MNILLTEYNQIAFVRLEKVLNAVEIDNNVRNKLLGL